MSHKRQDKASLDLATRIAAGLIDHPEWIELAKLNLDRWSRLNHDSTSLMACYREWQKILERPTAEISAVLTAQTDEGQRLRQNSPFAGALSPAEVWQIKRHAHAATTT